MSGMVELDLLDRSRGKEGLHYKKVGQRPCSLTVKSITSLRSVASSPRFYFPGPGRPRPGSEASGVSADVGGCPWGRFRGGVSVDVCCFCCVWSVFDFMSERYVRFA